jgi:hypothetical protein
MSYKKDFGKAFSLHIGSNTSKISHEESHPGKDIYKDSNFKDSEVDLGDFQAQRVLKSNRGNRSRRNTGLGGTGAGDISIGVESKENTGFNYKDV